MNFLLNGQKIYLKISTSSQKNVASSQAWWPLLGLVAPTWMPCGPNNLTSQNTQFCPLSSVCLSSVTKKRTHFSASISQTRALVFLQKKFHYKMPAVSTKKGKYKFQTTPTTTRRRRTAATTTTTTTRRMRTAAATTTTTTRRRRRRTTTAQRGGGGGGQ